MFTRVTVLINNTLMICLVSGTNARLDEWDNAMPNHDQNATVKELNLAGVICL